MQMANWISKVVWGGVAVVVIVSRMCLAAAADNEKEKAFRVPPGERQLFLDDVGISKVDHLKRTMHQPAKKGAVIRPDRPWETALQTRSDCLANDLNLRQQSVNQNKYQEKSLLKGRRPNCPTEIACE